MGYRSDFITTVGNDLMYFRETYLVTKMNELNKQIDDAKDEETKKILTVYKDELWYIAHEIGIVFDMISLDERVDLPTREKMRKSINKMKGKR